MKFREATLDNGLKIIAECNDGAYSTAVGFFVKTGSRDETDEVSGVSHFLEHMVFKGTPTRTADDVNREFDEIGAQYNAFTSEESTVYYAAVLPEFQDSVVRLWSDVMRPSLREEDFVTEKKVIIEEIRMYDDQPPFGADDKCRAAFYGKHPLGRSVLGTAQSVGDLPVEAMRDYFEARYCPQNITLCAAGRVDFDALIETAQDACGHWQPHTADRHSPDVATQNGFHTLQKEAATQEYLIELAAGPSATSDRRYAAKVAAMIVGDDGGSRLYWELVDPGLAEHAGLGHYEYEGAGLFMTYMCCDPDAAEGNVQRILDVYRRVEIDGVLESELKQAKSKINSRVVLGSERPRSRLFSVGGNWQHRHCYLTIKEELDAVAKITVDDVAAVLAEFPLTQNTSVAIGPLAEVAPPK